MSFVLAKPANFRDVIVDNLNLTTHFLCKESSPLFGRLLISCQVGNGQPLSKHYMVVGDTSYDRLLSGGDMKTAWLQETGRLSWISACLAERAR